MPGVRQENWCTIYQQTKAACKKNSWELIICGPYPLPSELQAAPNVKYIKDFGCPSRAFQISSCLAEGEYLTWFSDDAHIVEDSIDLAMDLLLTKDIYKDIILMRYSESPGRTAPDFPLSYWLPRSHPDMHAPGVDMDWICTTVALMNYQYFRFLGGISCEYEHTNMNLSGMGFRAIKNGSKIYYSPTVVQRCDCGPQPIQLAAFLETDRPKYKSEWSHTNQPISIDFENWRLAPTVWHRKKHIYGF